MSTQSSREKNIKKAIKIRSSYLFYGHILRFLKKSKKAPSKEIYIDTEFGKVRALCYGFDKLEKLPVFIDLHGGGFILGHPEMDQDMNLEIHEKVGCKVISIEYAKAPEFPFPIAANQVYAVAKYLYERADEYLIDRKRMAIGGHSAGGNLSAVACMKAKKEGLFQFVCQILDYPPLDLSTSPMSKSKPKGCIPPKIAMIFNDSYIDESRAQDPYVSPIYATTKDLEELPPALIILAGRDSLHDEGLEYNSMLQNVGVNTECYEYPKAAHGFTLKKSDETTDALGKMIGFLKKYFT